MKKTGNKFSISWLIFVFFCSLYLLTMNGYIVCTDGESMYQVTKSLVERYEFSIEPGLIRSVQGKYGNDGKFYALYGIGQSLLAAPFYLAAKFASFCISPASQEFYTRFSVSLLNVVITALWCTLIFNFALLFNFKKRTAVILSLIFGLATIAWPYSKYFFSEPAIGFFLTLSLFLLIKFCYLKKSKLLLLSSASLAAASLIKLSVLVVAPACIIYVILKTQQIKFRQLHTFIFLYFMPILAALIIVVIYNFFRFNSPLETGYRNLFDGKVFLLGIYGLLFSPGKSIFIYSPALILFFVSARRFMNTHRAEFYLFVLTFLSFLTLHAFWGAWDGGLCWGPRYLLPVIPLLALPMGFLFEPPPRKRALILKMFLAGLIILSMLIQLIPVLSRYDMFFNEIGSYLKANFDPRYFPITGQGKMLFRMNFETFKDSSLSGLDIHEAGFKDEFSKTFDLWFMYLFKFRSYRSLALLALLPFFTLFVSGYLLFSRIRSEKLKGN
jgi:hypothetical protein